MTTAPFFLGRGELIPGIGDTQRSEREFQRWEAEVARAALEVADANHQLSRYPECRALLDSIFSNSPFLTQSAFQDPKLFVDLLVEGPEAALGTVTERLRTLPKPGVTRDEVASKATHRATRSGPAGRGGRPDRALVAGEDH